MTDHGPGGGGAIILAGGRARRLGGAAKPGLEVHGRTLLARAVDAARAAGCTQIVVAGPPDPGIRGAVFVREDPPYGGPVAAIAAALPRVTEPWVLVLAADLPRAEEAVALLATGRGVTAGDGGPAGQDAARRDAGRDAAGQDARADTAPDDDADDGDLDGTCVVDAQGRRQPLLARYRTASLRGALAALGDAQGASMRRLLAPLRLREVPDAAGVSHDVDTWEDVWVARSARDHREGVAMAAADAPLPPEALDAWAAALADRFGLAPEDIPIPLVLDLARDVAHGVARPAAPLTAFVAGLVAGRRGGSPADVEAAVAAAVELAGGWRAD